MNWLDKIEPAAATLRGFGEERAISVSIAISLKRIADALEARSSMPPDYDLLCDWDDPNA